MNDTTRPSATLTFEERLALEPRSSRAPHRDSGNPYDGRWRPWYPAIADWLLANPGKPLTECAAHLGKAHNTIYYITNSDIFREYFARRRTQWNEYHDRALTQKLTAVTENALDAVLEKLEKKRDQIPMGILTELATSGLDRLGFAPKTNPSVAVQVNHTSDNRVQVAVSPLALEEARAALRLVEARKGLEGVEGPAYRPDVHSESETKVEDVSLSDDS